MNAAAGSFPVPNEDRRRLTWRNAAVGQAGTAVARTSLSALELAGGEQALIAKLRRGDRPAFTELVARYQNVVYGYLRARLIEPADAEDMCQEVFLRCYLGRDKFRRAAVVEAWLLGIARNVLHEHVRRLKRRREVAWTELCLELDRFIDSAAPAENDAMVHLPVCLESLGKSAREALEMHYRANLKLTEIGTKLKRSEGAVKLLMYRARQALKHCLDGKLKQESR
jgi:RNA polymerase sigma-70 factor (ECF subfamily)